jgi:hypothetical protein
VAAVTGRDWKQVRTELDELLPGAIETAGRPAPEQPLQPAVRWADEVSILKHITDALQLKDVGIAVAMIVGGYKRIPRVGPKRERGGYARFARERFKFAVLAFLISLLACAVLVTVA